MAPQPSLRDETFQQFARLIRETIGVRIGPDRRDTFERHLRAKLDELRLDDFEQYLAAIRDGGSSEELQELFDAVLDLGSHPLRDDAMQVRFLAEWLTKRAEDASTRARGLRCWSAGSGDGGEACELLALCVESARTLPVEVLGTDVHANAIERARRQAADPRLRFVHHNLLHPLDSQLGPFDLVLLRGVLPDFDATTRASVLRAVHSTLRPSGLLVLGDGESLLNVEHPFRLLQPSVFVRTLGATTESSSPKSRS